MIVATSILRLLLTIGGLVAFVIFSARKAKNNADFEKNGTYGTAPAQPQPVAVPHLLILGEPVWRLVQGALFLFVCVGTGVPLLRGLLAAERDDFWGNVIWMALCLFLLLSGLYYCVSYVRRKLIIVGNVATWQPVFGRARKFQLDELFAVHISGNRRSYLYGVGRGDRTMLFKLPRWGIVGLSPQEKQLEAKLTQLNIRFVGSGGMQTDWR